MIRHNTRHSTMGILISAAKAFKYHGILITMITMTVLQGTPALIIPTIKAKLIKTLLANYAMWPLAHIINFKFIPSSQRILYINCVQVI